MEMDNRIRPVLVGLLSTVGLESGEIIRLQIHAGFLQDPCCGQLVLFAFLRLVVHQVVDDFRVAVNVRAVIDAAIAKPVVAVARLVLVRDDQVKLTVVVAGHLHEEFLDCGILIYGDHARLFAIASVNMDLDLIHSRTVVLFRKPCKQKEFAIANRKPQCAAMDHPGARIRALRTTKGITLPALADRAGLSKGLLWKIETDDSSNPSLSTLFKIAESLDTTLADILNTVRVVPKPPPPIEESDWTKELVGFLRSQGKEPAPDILNAIQLLRHRKAPKKRDLEHLKFLYTSIENSFKE